MADDPSRELMLNYAELGERLGVSPDGARTKAKRAGWPVIMGNDGRARVRVAAAELPEQPPERARPSLEQKAERPGQLAELNRLLSEFIAEMLARASKAEQEAEQARAALGQARERVIQLEAEREGIRAAAAAREELLAELRRALEHERACGPSTEVDRHPSAARDKLQAELEEGQRQLKARDLMIDMLQRPQRSKPWWRRLIG